MKMLSLYFSEMGARHYLKPLLTTADMESRGQRSSLLDIGQLTSNFSPRIALWVDIIHRRLKSGNPFAKDSHV